MRLPQDIADRLTAQGVEFDASELEQVALALATQDLWRVIEGEEFDLVNDGLKDRYPSRLVYPFARRDDCDNVACLVVEDPERPPLSVVVIHDFASPGYEVEAEAESLATWREKVLEVSEPPAGLVLSRSARGTDYWLSRPYLPDDLRAELASAAIILVPQEGFRGIDHPMFPNGTEEFFAHLRDVNPDEVVDICVSEEDYQALALHGDMLILASLVMPAKAATKVIKQVSDYLKKRLLSSIRDTVLRVSMTIEFPREAGRSAFQVSFDGPADEFEGVVSPVVERAIRSPGSGADGT